MHEPETKKSIAWKFFEKLESDQVRCFRCDIVLKYSKNTTNLFDHIKRRHNNAFQAILNNTAYTDESSVSNSKTAWSSCPPDDESWKVVKIPQKSKAKYEFAYDRFMQWRSEKNIDSFAESVFLDYFKELASSHKPSSLLMTYSALRSMIYVRHKLNTNYYSDLRAFLKQNSKGYKTKGKNVISDEQMNRFLQEAPDNKFLAVKVALIFRMQGACRKQELCDLTINDLEDKDDMLLVKIPKNESFEPISFVIKGQYYEIYKKYASLRPKNVSSTRFFLCYRNGKCVNQVIGINTFGIVPKTVAEFLKLEAPESYTGYSLKRITAKPPSDSGSAKRHRNPLWNSNIVPECCFEDSNDPDQSLTNACDETQETELQAAQSSIAQLEKRRSMQQSQIAKLQAYIKTLGVTIQTLSKFAKHVVDRKPGIELPTDVQCIIKQVGNIEKQRKKTERKLSKLRSVKSQVESPSKASEDLNERKNDGSPMRNKVPFFENLQLREKQQQEEQIFHEDAISDSSNNSPPSSPEPKQMRFPKLFIVATKDYISRPTTAVNVKNEEIDPLSMVGD